MPGLVPGIHDDSPAMFKDVDGHPGPASPARAQAQDKPGHDEEGKGEGQVRVIEKAASLLWIPAFAGMTNVGN
jgi:hypothetical protein